MIAVATKRRRWAVRPFLIINGAAALLSCAQPSENRELSRTGRMAIGLVGGAVGALTALPRAAVVVWADRRGYGMERLRGLLQPYILVIQRAGVIGLWHAGLLDLDGLAPLFVKALPALALGLALGFYLDGFLDQRRVRSNILSLVMLFGGLMLRG